jgi:uncharacterized protein (DUF2147 family)
MKKLYILAALLMASTSAHAGNSISFEIDGHKIHIEAPRNCDSLSCIQVSASGLSGSGFDLKGFKSKSFGSDDDVAAPAQPAVPATAPQPAAPIATAPAPVAATPPDSVPAVGFETTPAAPVAAPVVAQPAPVAAPTTPLGVWATEENKGNVRVEACGTNLCGYSINTNEKILINMKPSDNKWTGQIHDPDSGRNYDSTIAMKGANSMRVQGCAFGGMFCGGQTWNRVS